MVSRLTGWKQGEGDLSSTTFSKRKSGAGYTLGELLVVIAIIMILVLIVVALGINWKRQADRGNDTRRKSDLTLIRNAFEEYYNDHNCYPAATILDNCGSADLAPYLAAVPCDPVTKLPYKYVPADDTNLCKGYRVLTTLYDTSDQAITNLNCNPVTGCGWGAGYNWGLSQGVPVAKDGFDASATPTPTPTPGGPGDWACDRNGICNRLDKTLFHCQYWYQTAEICTPACADPATWCFN